MKSIIETEPAEQCFLCGAWGPLEKHHIFDAANRSRSERYGLTVHLCPYCHRDNKAGVHNNAERMRYLQQIGQRAFEQTHTRKQFMDWFGKNYLDLGENQEKSRTAEACEDDLSGIIFLED